MSLPFFAWVPGTIVVMGKQPDGDSVRFVPDEADALARIYRAHLLRPSRTDGSHQLRLEGIDAPETHYGGHAQPLGHEARDHFLKRVLGFGRLEFKGETVAAARPKTLKGAILTQSADVHGRPICYLLREGDTANPFDDTATGRVEPDRLAQTANLAMLQAGFAYPLLYTSTPREHRAVFTEAGRRARDEKLGVWDLDASPRFALQDRGSIDAGAPAAQLVFPKLFRRATDYLTAVERGFEGDLVDWLERNGTEDDLVVVNGTNEVPLSVLLRRENDRYRFDADVTETVFVER